MSILLLSLTMQYYVRQSIIKMQPTSRTRKRKLKNYKRLQFVCRYTVYNIKKVALCFVLQYQCQSNNTETPVPSDNAKLFFKFVCLQNSVNILIVCNSSLLVDYPLFLSWYLRSVAGMYTFSSEIASVCFDRCNASVFVSSQKLVSWNSKSFLFCMIY